MTWVEHMEELRRRILKSLLAVGIGMVAAFFFMDPIMAFLTRSAGTLYFLKPAEAFMTYFKVLAVVGLLLASPVWFYQLWAFLLPALTQKEKKTLLAFVPFRCCCSWAAASSPLKSCCPGAWRSSWSSRPRQCSRCFPWKAIWISW